MLGLALAKRIQDYLESIMDRFCQWAHMLRFVTRLTADVTLVNVREIARAISAPKRPRGRYANRSAMGNDAP